MMLDEVLTLLWSLCSELQTCRQYFRIGNATSGRRSGSFMRRGPPPAYYHKKDVHLYQRPWPPDISARRSSLFLVLHLSGSGGCRKLQAPLAKLRYNDPSRPSLRASLSSPHHTIRALRDRCTLRMWPAQLKIYSSRTSKSL